MSYLLHAEGMNFSIIEREYEKDTQTNKLVRLERIIESDLSFSRAKARLRYLIQQKEALAEIARLEQEEASAPIGESAPSDLLVLESAAGFYVGRTFDGMPYERISGYFPSYLDAQAFLDSKASHFSH